MHAVPSSRDSLKGLAMDTGADGVGALSFYRCIVGEQGQNIQLSIWGDGHHDPLGGGGCTLLPQMPCSVWIWPSVRARLGDDIEPAENEAGMSVTVIGGLTFSHAWGAFGDHCRHQRAINGTHTRVSWCLAGLGPPPRRPSP